MAQLFSLGHERFLRLSGAGWQAEIIGSSVFGEIGGRHIGRRTARAGLSASGRCGSLSKVGRHFMTDICLQIDATWPNKSPEPTAVTPALLSRSHRLAGVICPPWLSFFR